MAAYEKATPMVQPDGNGRYKLSFTCRVDISDPSITLRKDRILEFAAKGSDGRTYKYKSKEKLPTDAERASDVRTTGSTFCCCSNKPKTRGKTYSEVWRSSEDLNLYI